jgi:hypothetical protein
LLSDDNRPPGKLIVGLIADSFVRPKLMPVKTGLTGWLEPLQRELAETEEHFRILFPPEAPPWPIPFFGKLFQADILTLGVNPSCGELETDRWKGVTKADQVEKRLLTYFACTTPPHPWFETWESALQHLDASYYGTRKYLAAHLDLSPRATMPASQVDQELFIELVMNDLFSFVRFLDLAVRTRIVLMAGAVSGDYYVNEFLSEHLAAGAELRGSFNPRTQAGPAKTAFHWLKTGKQNLRVFFCSTSPSDRENRFLLVERIEEQAGVLKRLGRL